MCSVSDSVAPELDELARALLRGVRPALAQPLRLAARGEARHQAEVGRRRGGRGRGHQLAARGRRRGRGLCRRSRMRG